MAWNIKEEGRLRFEKENVLELIKHNTQRDLANKYGVSKSVITKSVRIAKMEFELNQVERYISEIDYEFTPCNGAWMDSKERLYIKQ